MSSAESPPPMASPSVSSTRSNSWALAVLSAMTFSSIVPYLVEWWFQGRRRLLTAPGMPGMALGCLPFRWLERIGRLVSRNDSTAD